MARDVRRKQTRRTARRSWARAISALFHQTDCVSRAGDIAARSSILFRFLWSLEDAMRRSISLLRWLCMSSTLLLHAAITAKVNDRCAAAAQIRRPCRIDRSLLKTSPHLCFDLFQPGFCCVHVYPFAGRLANLAPASNQNSARDHIEPFRIARRRRMSRSNRRSCVKLICFCLDGSESEMQRQGIANWGGCHRATQ